MIEVDAVKLARAIGYVSRQVTDYPAHIGVMWQKDNNHWTDKTDEEMQRYLNSPEGREAVREWVRKKWCVEEKGQHISVDYGATCVGLRLYENCGGNYAYYVDADTEAEAYFAAAKWLAENGQNCPDTEMEGE